MQLDLLLDIIEADLQRDERLLTRIANYYLPIILLPLGLALAQIPRSWVGFVIGTVAIMVFSIQFGFSLRPIMRRIKINSRDLAAYLPTNAQSSSESTLAHAVPLLIPSLIALGTSLVVAISNSVSTTESWQRWLAFAIGLAMLWNIWHELSQLKMAFARFYQSLQHVRQTLQNKPQPPTSPFVTLVTAGNAPFVTLPTRQSAPQPPPQLPLPATGLLDPTLAGRIMRMPWPAMRLSPAAQALLRIEAYLMLQNAPGRSDYDIIQALHGLAHEAQTAEIRHGLLPTIGGKIYLPITADGLLANRLAQSVRILGMDGAYSATLGTWLVRLPPARSYQVASRLIDATIALRILPPHRVLPHHLTLAGDLGRESRLLSILHLISTPLILEARPDHAQGDERPFIMRGGGVLDDLQGRGRGSGPRTDFVDGFLLPDLAELRAVEHLTAHAMNLQLKQVLAYGLLAAQTPPERQRPDEQQAARVWIDLRRDLSALLADYHLSEALNVDWLDQQWSQLWEWIAQVNNLKQNDPDFLDQTQHFRNYVIQRLELIATGVGRKPETPIQ
jgi:hypothetical protein